jgi:hypothetical protein
MTSYTVYFSAYLSDSIEVEADSEDEALDMARSEVESDWSAYSSAGGYTVPFNDIEIDEIQES